MSKRNELLVAVRDPKGKLFEVTRRNATDLVQHSGWSYDRPAMSTTDELATAGRKRIPRGEKVAAARKLAAEEKAAVEDTKPPKKAKKAVKIKIPDYENEEEDADDLEPFDAAQAEDIEDELDELEAEEEARIPKGE